MADETEPTPATPADFFSQMSSMAARLWGMDGSTPGMTPEIPRMPQVGALSAQQFSAMVTTVKAQRQSIEALQTQLQAFDEHLATLQQILEPLLSWSTSWAALEKTTGLRPGAPDRK